MAGEATFLIWAPLSLSGLVSSHRGLAEQGRAEQPWAVCSEEGNTPAFWAQSRCVKSSPLQVASPLANREQWRRNRVKYWFVFLDGKLLKKQLYGNSWEEIVWFNFGHQSPNSVIYKPRCRFVEEISACQELHPWNCCPGPYWVWLFCPCVLDLKQE